jgi:2-polyprenyl-3-methyl-5-hydroxy-6-metoxy-1,4-benzoquinol methylase
MWFRERSKEPEIMDLGLFSCTLEEYEECLGMLGKIGKILGGNRISISALQKLYPFDSLLDAGCGSGDFADLVARKFSQAEVVGFDIEKMAIDYASSKFKQPNLSFQLGTALPQKQFDIITTTLVCHHFDDTPLVEWIKQVYQKSNKAVVINDLHRHSAAFALYACLSFLLFPNRLIREDGLLSIRKGFKRKDWLNLLTRAEIPMDRVSIKWKWPFRWCVILHR